MLDSLTRIWTLVVKDFTQLRRDWLMIGFVTLVPLGELLLIGWATSSHIEHLPTAVLDADSSAESRALVTALENARTFDVSHFPDSPAAVNDLVDRGTVVVGVTVPEGFGAGVTSLTAPPPQVQVILDGADPVAAETAQRSIEGVIAALGQQATDAAGRQAREWPGRSDPRRRARALQREPQRGKLHHPLRDGHHADGYRADDRLYGDRP